MAARTITAEETAVVQQLVGRARAAMRAIEDYDQAAVDRVCRAVAWAGGNLETATRLASMSVDESGMGRREPTRRAKVQGILRDALRQKSMGIIEEDPARGLVKYAKPAGVIAALIPVTSPYVTPVGIAIYAIKCKDAVIFSPHPASRKTTIETVRIMRAALARLGVPEDVVQVVERPSIPVANELMAQCDLTIATGGPAMVRAAYGSGKPAYGVGAGNATMVIDETANVEEAARNTRISKTNDNGSGCSADGNLLVDSRIYDALLERLQHEGGYLVSDDEKARLQAAYWDAEGRRTADTIARGADVIAAKAGITLPEGRTFFIVPERLIGKAHPFSTEKLGVVLSIFKYHGWEMALDMVRQIFETGGRGHSCGIYSFDATHIHQLALVAPVSRIMVRQVQSSSNAGTFTNGMPMTSSMGCGVWGGNITNENISLKHYMNVTWVSRPIPEDKPSEEELFGEFYNSAIPV
jgi:sulfoacetaldehyde dehydrogenase